MGEPRRIQLSRKKGFRLHDVSPNAVVVSRPTKWGNPWREGSTGWTVKPGGRYDREPHPPLTRQQAVDVYRNAMTHDPAEIEYIRQELAGKDVACWCRLDQPCHGDVLLAIAAGRLP